MTEQKERLFRFILEHSQEAVIRYDDTGSICYMNAKALEHTGYSAQELQGKFIGELFKDIFYKEEGSVRIEKDFLDMPIIDTVLYRKNTTCFPVDLKIVSGIIDGFAVSYCMAIDTTVIKESIRKIAEVKEQTKDSIKERDTFVATVTHELRTPLNGIKGHTELLLEEEQDFQKRNSLKIIQDCCATMEGIINNILDFSKLEAGKFQLEEKPFSFHNFMEKTEKMFAMLVERKGLKLMMSVDEEIPDELIGDELKITQILNNLISNATKFTQKGYIGVEVVKNMQFEDEIELFFLVLDTGIGLSKKDKDKLFKNFSQVDSSISRKYGGTGLGLAIAKELVTMMDGDIWVEGEKGKGSTFSFTIRLRIPEKQKEKEERASLGEWKPADAMYHIAGEKDLMYQYGSEINGREIRSSMEKLVICLELQNWYRAEEFVSTLKKLLKGGSQELEKLAFKLEMAVRKEDYEKAAAYIEACIELLKQEWR